MTEDGRDLLLSSYAFCEMMRRRRAKRIVAFSRVFTLNLGEKSKFLLINNNMIVANGSRQDVCGVAYGSKAEALDMDVACVHFVVRAAWYKSTPAIGI